MKHVYLSFFLLILSCVSLKKTSKEVIEKSKNNIEDATIKPNKEKEELIVVIKNPKKLEDTRAIITNSGLEWKKLIFNQGSTKIALLKVPVNKKDFWIKRLKQSGMFSSVELNSNERINTIKNEIKNTLVALRKTPCFGNCSVFNIRIDKEGRAYYNGIKHVIIQGKREFKLTKVEFKILKEKLSKTTFSSYESSYDNPRLMDAPSTFIKHQNKEIQLRVLKNVPKELIEVTKYIENLLLSRKFYE